MRSREYTKRVYIYSTTEAADGYGGYTTTSSYVGESWAKIQTAGESGYSSKLTDMGITQGVESIVVTMRHRNDITPQTRNYFLIYNDYIYVVQGILNVNLLNVDLVMFATRQEATDLIT